MTQVQGSHPAKAASWMVGALLSFSVLAIAARELSDSMDTLELLFLRTVVGLAIVLALVLGQGRKGLAGVRTRRLKTHLARSSVHYCGQYTWFLGLTMLPLAELFALEFTMPIWAAILAVLFLGEKMNGGRAVAILAGFAGVLIIVQPGVRVIDPAALIVLASAVFFAVNHIFTKHLSSTEAPLTILFYMNVMQLPISLVPALFVWTPPQLADLHWIVAVGAASLSAHYCLANALRLADAIFVIPIDFLRLPLIAVVGFFFYAEGFDAAVLIGAAVMFAGNYFHIRRESRGPAEKQSAA